MAIYPGAKKRLIAKWNVVRMTRYRRMNLHVAVSNASSIHSMFSNSNSACSHFYVAKDGTVEQYIDTAYRSASDMSGNDSTISVETAGGVSSVNGEQWTDAQVEALAKLWAWARDTHNIRNQIAKNTQTNENSEGLSWHRLGVEGNFGGRGGILETSYKPGGIKYSSARGKECPGDAKILQVPGIWAQANSGIKPVASKPVPVKKPVKKPVASKPAPAKDKSGSWPEKPLKVTSAHTVESDAAWRELMYACKYRDEDLGVNLQNWLKDQGYYKYAVDGVFGERSVKALQSFLSDKGLLDTRKYLIDGKRGPATIKAEIAYLNLPANRGVK